MAQVREAPGDWYVKLPLVPYDVDTFGEKGPPVRLFRIKCSASTAARNPSTSPLHTPTCKQQ